MFPNQRSHKVFARYFSRHGLWCRPEFPNDPDAVVVIPVLDDRDIFRTVDSLLACTHAEGAAGTVIVVNHGVQAPERVKEANRQLAAELRGYVAGKPSTGMAFQIVEAFDLPAKTAGVGQARKIGMDAAAHWLHAHGKEACPILSLDADTLVEPDYLDAVCRYFRTRPVAGVSIAYAHRLEECEGEALAAMVKYELYLRYYHAALAYAGHPHAFHCIGSAFAVRAEDYVAEGGMNKRQAGEDFYFLQKLMATGRYASLAATTVHPSPRLSARTPFGTGQSLRRIIDAEGAYPVYAWEAFRDLRCFFGRVDGLYRAAAPAVASLLEEQAPAVRAYWAQIGGDGMLAEVNANCASPVRFRHRFFDNFNAFRVLKYLNFAHGEHYAKADVSIGASRLLAALGMEVPATDLGLLHLFRAGEIFSRG